MSQPTPPTEHILQFFDYSHLSPERQAVSKAFADLAHALVYGDNAPEAGNVTLGGPLPRNPERTVALRKLLESKDAAVRAAFAKDVSTSERPPQPSPDHVWDNFASRWHLPGAQGPAISSKTTAA
ncbi:hypothetical protein [Myxococcus phage Mx4 ts27htf-1hrm-1]|nr:hypothetical protein Mx4_p77 [Myxococcus phage Mx4]WNM70416.1 hypothetical protein [Myxococcus phage Mx4 ts27htf-1hrm-1]